MFPGLLPAPYAAMRGLGWLWAPSGCQIPVGPEVSLPGSSPHFALCPWVCYILCVTSAELDHFSLGTSPKKEATSGLSLNGGGNAWEGETVGMGVYCPNKFLLCLSPSWAEEDWLCVPGRPIPSP